MGITPYCGFENVVNLLLPSVRKNGCESQQASEKNDLQEAGGKQELCFISQPLIFCKANRKAALKSRRELQGKRETKPKERADLK